MLTSVEDHLLLHVFETHARTMDDVLMSLLPLVHIDVYAHQDICKHISCYINFLCSILLVNEVVLGEEALYY